VFIPDGADKTLAEMYEKEKQSVWKTHVAWKQAVEYILSQEVK
jgi:inosine/xanthosine triphosphate pyrophosphatase family protein